MRLGASAVIVAAAVLVAAMAASPTTRAQQSATVDILFDLGDGTYYWSRVTIPDRFATNASWRATLDAAGGLGLWVAWRWYPGLGIAVGDIGDRRGPAGFAGLFRWNASAGAWQPSASGISSLVLADGDAIAWDNAAYDSVDYTMRTPVPTPAYPYPAMGFRGDGVSGGTPGLQAVGSGTSASEAPSGVNLLWDRDLGTREIVSTPAVAYGMAYVETFDGLYALDDFTGTVRWHDPAVKGFSSPAVFDGSVIVGASDGRVYRLDAFDGSELWNTSLVPEPRFSGITSSPRVAFDWVYIGTFNESGGPGEVVSLWASNGTVAWRHATGSIHYSSPAILRGTLYVGVMGRYNTTTNVTFDPPYGVLALYASNGTERWFFPAGGPVAASPLVTGSIVIAPSKDGNLYAINMSNGTERWRVSVDAGVSSPALVGDTVFVGGGALLGSGRVTAVNRTTGAVIWTYAPNGPVQSSVSYADGKVFVSTNTAQGRVYALDSASGDLVWFAQPSPANYILASPVVANGTLYAPSDNGHVLAYRELASNPLAVVSVSPVDLKLAVGQEANVTITARALLGRADQARLTVLRTPQIEIVSVTPSPSQPPATWDLGAIEFLGNRTVTLRIRAVSTDASFTDPRVTGVLEYFDSDGTPFTAMGSARVTVYENRVDYVPYAIAAAGFALLAVLLFLLWRRRRGPR